MMLEEIVKMYGIKADYLDCPTGRIFKLSNMEYDKDKDVTRVPVYEDNRCIGTALMKGDWTKENVKS